MTAVRCRAKDPASCRVHGTRRVREGTPEWFQQQPETPSAPTRPLFTDPAPVARALEANLGWEGEKPSWWAEYAATVEGQEASCTPELLDMIDTPEGPVAVVWLENSPKPRDQNAVTQDGMRLNYLGFYHPGTQDYLGYVKMIFVDEETKKAAFGEDELAPYRWGERYAGGLYVDLPAPEEWAASSEEEKDEFRRELWRAATRESGEGIMHEGEWIPPYRMSDAYIPANPERIKHDLDTLHAPRFLKRQQEQEEYFKLPFVDFSRMEDPLKGKGYGSAAYVYTARRLAQEGKVLRASGTQSGEAQTTWGRFRARFADNVKTVYLKDGRGKKIGHSLLDFR